ncbi:MAG: GAF domain-containing protein [Acidimicrobiales bacterium]|nr:GAF domain-containing protein [Acidimicrobiales bacterium]
MATWELDSPERLKALSEVDTFPGVPDEAFAVYTRLIAKLLDAPTALVSFVTDDRQFFPAAVGIGEPWASRGGTPLALSFCQHVVRSDDDLVIPFADEDDRVKDNAAITELDVHAYLGVPLRAPGGEPLGALCAIDSKARDWTAGDLAIMHDLAEAVADTIALRVSEHRRAELAAGASHELRTPLARLRFELDDLSHAVVDVTDARQGVAAAVEHVDELASIVDDLMQLAQTGPLRETDVDLFAICYESAAHHESLADGEPGKVVLEGQSVTVRASRTVLRRVIDLLLESIGEGPTAVRVRADGGVARVQICEPAELKVLADLAAAHRLAKTAGARILTRPSPDVAYELVIPRV